MKIAQRMKDDWMRIAVLGGETTKFIGTDPESAEFFELVSSLLINELDIHDVTKNDGPDSSRWMGTLRGVQIYFEFDDMVGTTICVNSLASDSASVTDDIIKLLKTY